MPKPSLRHNLLALVGLYAFSLVVAAGCPTAAPKPAENAAPATDTAKADSKPASTPIADTAPAETAGSDIKVTNNASEAARATEQEIAAKPNPEVAAAEAPAADPAESTPAETPPAASDAGPVTQVAAVDPAADKPAGHGLVKKTTLDPVAVNGKFFEGWKKPKVALVFTGRQDGYLEPCGCAGLDNQKGGLSRRHDLFKQLRKQGWNLVPLDVGNLVRRFGKQAELQFTIAADALKPNANDINKTLGYTAVGFGPNDLRLSGGEIGAVVAANTPEESLFVSANVNIFDFTPRFRIVEVGGMKIGITSVLGAEFAAQVNNPDVVITAAADALEEVVPELKDCDVRVLLANATPEETVALAKKFPQFDYVVPGAGPDEPPAEAEKIPGTKSRLIEVGHKGMFAIVVGLYDDPKQPMRYQRVALDSRYKNTPEMKKLMTTYQSQLESLGWNELGLRPAPHPRSSKTDKLAGRFVGSEKCQACHQDAYDVWAASKHAHATETLVKLNPHREYDPECISCHATGWNPQEYFPYVSGFDSLKTTPQLVGNGCENCHGPGASHVAAEEGDNEKLQKQLRELMKYTEATAQDVKQDNSCYKCHDLDNSPEFKFETYWKEIAH